MSTAAAISGLLAGCTDDTGGTTWRMALVRQANPDVDAAAAAERLTALVEGLSERWHSGSLTLERARELLSGAIARELG